MNPLIKICGITSITDADIVCQYNINYLGFIFYEKSPRYITKETIEKISLQLQSLPYSPKKIGVFVNPTLTELENHSIFIDGFQLHGDESPKHCREIQKRFPNHEIWKAFRIATEKDLEKIKKYHSIQTILVDAFSEKKNEYGGSGKTIDKTILPKIKNAINNSQRLFLAGGINEGNKDEMLNKSNAHGIDLSSSIEISPGKKSRKKIKNFFKSKNT